MKKLDLKRLQSGDWVKEKRTGRSYQVDGQEGDNMGIHNIHLKDYPYLGFQSHTKFTVITKLKKGSKR